MSFQAEAFKSLGALSCFLSLCHADHVPDQGFSVGMVLRIEENRAELQPALDG